MKSYFKVIILSLITPSICLNADIDTNIKSHEKEVYDYIPHELALEGTQLLVNGEAFRLKGISFEPFMPGETPAYQKMPAKVDYEKTFKLFKELNVNTVTYLTGDPDNVSDELFIYAKKYNIYIALGLWFPTDANDYSGREPGDFQHPAFKNHVKKLIRKFIDKVHHVDGKDYSDIVLYYNLGNELLPWAIDKTNDKYPEITAYHGKFVSTENNNATGCFFAEMVDYLKTYENETYGHLHYVTHHTWPHVSPYLVDYDFLDIISYNLYAYGLDPVIPHGEGSVTQTSYQGALEALSALYPQKPFVVSEFGKAVPPGPLEAHIEIITTDEAGQAQELQDRWKDIITAPRYIAGGFVHQLYDQWWKGLPPAHSGVDCLSKEAGDLEEWFGIVDVSGDVNDFVFTKRKAFDAVKMMYDEEK